MNVSSIAGLTLVALLGITLSGCDAAEESAQKLTDKAAQAAQQLAREAVSDTVNALNEQIDQAQKSTNELLGKPQDETANDKPKGEPEAPPASVGEGVET